MKIKQAITIIADETKLIGSIALASLQDPVKMLDFVCYIADQCEQGNEAQLKKDYGAEVIDTILNYKRDVILSSVPCLEYEKEINQKLKDCLRKYKR